jgi:hypothetical protein
MACVLVVLSLGWQGDAARPLQRLASWTSLELRVRGEQINNTDVLGAEAWPRLTTSFHYVEAADGRRYLEEIIKPSGEDPDTESRHYLDGSRAATITRATARGRVVTHARIRRDFYFEKSTGWRGCPYPLATWYAGLRPLRDALGTARPLGQVRVLDRVCDLYEIDGPTHHYARATYALDRETGVPLELKCYPKAETSGTDEPVVHWMAESLDDVGGLWMPIRSRFIQYTGTSPRKEMTREEILVEEVVVDPDLSAFRFWPEIGPDVLLIDEVEKRVRPASVAPLGAEPPGSAAAIGADASQEEGGWWWTGALIGLGASLLAIGFTMHVRRAS